MIQQPSDNNYSRKHMLLIAGSPGIGKSTLALSAPSPLFIDCDQNLDKVNPIHRICPYINPSSYEEILIDLETDLSEFESIIIDTGGSFIDYMKIWAGKQSPKNIQKNGSLSLQGYGFIKREFRRIIDRILLEKKKHVIMVCHLKEKQDDEINRLILDIEGSSSEYVWQKSDLAAMMFVFNGTRHLGFSPTENYHAKPAFGISGLIPVKELKPGEKNTMVSDLFKQAEESRKKETEMIIKYKSIMANVRDLIDKIIDIDGLNDVKEKFSTFEWVFSSNREAWTMLKNKADELGFEYDRNEKIFTNNNRKEL